MAVLEQVNAQLLPSERRAIAGLAAIFALRLLGVFMLLPVLALHAQTLFGVTPHLLGMALGIYGLSQALMQFPMGYYSDRLGRKAVIAVGQLLFALGSLLGAHSQHIVGLIAGRALQGGGAVGSTLLAAVADSTRPEVRTRAMALMGMTIGGSFTLALILGPLLQPWFKVVDLFYLGFLFALLGTIVLLWLVPVLPQVVIDSSHPNPRLISMLTDRRLWPLNIGIFILHAVLVMQFVAIPNILLNVLNVAQNLHWQIYLPALLLAILTVFPLIRAIEKRNCHQVMAKISLAILLLSQMILYFYHSAREFLVVGLTIFFVAFNYLESYLPAQISKSAPAEQRGAAIGIYSTAQFLGVFAGGMLAGYLSAWSNVENLFLFSACGVSMWLLIFIVI